jgi:hypothetical protein
MSIFFAAKLTFWPLEPLDIREFLREFGINFLSRVCVFEEFFCLSRCLTFSGWCFDRLSRALLRRTFDWFGGRADELRAAVEGPFYRISSSILPPFLGIALAVIGETGFAICEEDSLSEALVSACLSPFSSRFLLSLPVSDRTSLRIPSLKRSAMVRRISSKRSSSRVLGGPRERSLGVGPSRGGLADVSARAVLLGKFWMVFVSESLSVAQ